MNVVYALKSSDEDLPFYVGRRKDTYDRLRTHLYHAKHYRKTPCHKKILECLARGAVILEVILHDNLSETESYNIERLEISERGRIRDGSGYLVNVTSGGQGCSAPFTDERRKLMSDIMQGNTNGKWSKGKNLGNTNAEAVSVNVFDETGKMISSHRSMNDCDRAYGLKIGRTCIAIIKNIGFHANNKHYRLSTTLILLPPTKTSPKERIVRSGYSVILTSPSTILEFDTINKTAEYLLVPVHKLRYAEKNKRTIKTPSGDFYEINFKMETRK